MFVNLSPRRLLRDPLVGATRCRAFDLRPMNVEHGGQRGDVEDVADAVLRELRGALGVGHSADLPRQIGPLKAEHESVTKTTKLLLHLLTKTVLGITLNPLVNFKAKLF